ncbi:MAG: iron-containing alcohol dehydrogenase [Alphaproteobacteria bacterium]|nr:iron-containing alcohol dehydrogenase [Alphaproteobacteria bacterium]
MTTLLPVPEITIGRDRIDGIGDMVESLVGTAACVLLVADPGLRRGGSSARVEAALARKGHRAVLFEGFASNPSAAEIDAAAARARAERAQLVIGLGGGSALDVAKLVGAIATEAPGSAHYQFCRNPLPARGLPVIAVPTTAGTGSETTITAVFTNAAGKKAWAWGSALKSAAAILDPTLTVGLPAGLTAQTGVDALVHAIEAATNRNRSAANDIYAHAAIRLVRGHLLAAIRHPEDLAAREAMLLASCLAGIAINNAGTAIGHNVAHALGSLVPIHHGRAAGLGLRAALGWNIAVARPAWDAVAEAFGLGRDAALLPSAIDGFLREIGVKVSLRDEFPALTAERLAAEMALEENASMRRSNAREASADDLLAIANAVLAAA